MASPLFKKMTLNCLDIICIARYSHLSNRINIDILFLTRFNKIAIQGTPQMAVD